MHSLFSSNLYGALAPIFLWATLATASPLVLEQPGGLVDAGDVWEGGLKTVVMPIRNAGVEVAKIDQVVAGCHCSKPDPFFDSIAPGATVPLRIQFDAAGLAGELERTVEIYANGLTQSVFTAKYKIRINRIFVAFPESVDMKAGKPGEIVPKVVRIDRMKGEGKVIGVTANDSRLKVGYAPSGQGHWNITVTVAPDAKAGAFMAVVSVKTDDPVRPEVGLLVTADVRGE